MDLKSKLEHLDPIVREAGRIIMSYQGGDKNIQYKDRVNLVTRADQESEIYIYNELSRVFPEDAILAEEGHKKDGTSGFTWIVDPLDGTTSYAHGFPFFCISAGLVDKDNNPVLGMVFAPMLGEVFTAILGGGAFLNGKPITVSQTPEMGRSLVGTGFPYTRREIMDRLMHRLANFLFIVHDVRRTGSAALDLSYVACGRLDAYFEEGLQPWDCAAAAVILTEAGGKITRFDGSPFDLFIQEAAASNTRVHAGLVELLGKK